MSQSFSCACKGNTEDRKSGKVLIAYFSATGTTAKAANLIAEETGGELYRIEPAQPYTGADLNWNDKASRSSVEMNNPNSRPAIKENKANIADYDTIYIGYPIWWDVAPRIINTFMEGCDLRGRKIVIFATSGGSTITNSVAVLKKTYPNLDWKDGKLFNNSSETLIRAWLDKLGFKI